MQLAALLVLASAMNGFTSISMRISVAVASCTGILGRANGDIVRATGRNEGASLMRYPLSYGRQSSMTVAVWGTGRPIWCRVNRALVLS